MNTAEARDALMKASTRVSVEITDLKTNIANQYASIREAARGIGVFQSALGRYLLGKCTRPYKGRYVIKSCDRDP